MRLLRIILASICWIAFTAHVVFADEGPEITSATAVLPHAIKDVEYSYTLEIKGGAGGVKWKPGNSPNDLPPGLRLDEKSGEIYGVPTTEAPKKPVQITVEDGNANKHSRDFWITVFGDRSKQSAAIADECFTDVGEQSLAGDLSKNVSVGPSITTQLIRYNFATEKASINAKGIGVGAAFRFYNDNDMAAAPGSAVKDIRRIRPKCRANTLTTFEGDAAQYKASSWLSISPTIFASVDEVQGSAASEVSVQPALMVGFLRDLINVGVGWNLAGPNRGQVFLLMGIGTGFKF